MKKILLWILELFPKRLIQDERRHNSTYMVRYFILRTPWLGIFIHNILLSDIDTFHDHPWDFISVILSEGYTEHTPSGKKWYGPRSVNFRQAEYLHRLEVPKPAWTLVFRFAYRREWGFLNTEGSVVFEEPSGPFVCTTRLKWTHWKKFLGVE